MEWILYSNVVGLYLSGKDSGSSGMTQERETCVIPGGFEAVSFPLKYNPTTSQCKIHYFKIDLHYLK